MKKILFLLFAVVFTSALSAEDVVTTYEGEASYYIPNYGGLSVYQFDEPELVRKGSKVFKDGVKMSQREYKNFLANTCPEAYRQYRKGTTLANAGWGTLVSGTVVMLCVGVPLMTNWRSEEYYSEYVMDGYWNEYYDYYYDRWREEWVDTSYWREGYRDNSNYSMRDAGISMLVIGGAAIVASVPMICVGYSKRHKSVDTYNQSCSADDITYNLKVGNNSLGLAINF